MGCDMDQKWISRKIITYIIAAHLRVCLFLPYLSQNDIAKIIIRKSQKYFFCGNFL